jgi:hypothetical protein
MNLMTRNFHPVQRGTILRAFQSAFELAAAAIGSKPILNLHLRRDSGQTEGEERWDVSPEQAEVERQLLRRI